jgi:hypothetical protein
VREGFELGGAALEVLREAGSRGNPFVEQLDRDEVLAARDPRELVLGLVNGTEPDRRSGGESSSNVGAWRFGGSAGISSAGIGLPWCMRQDRGWVWVGSNIFLSSRKVPLGQRYCP